MFSNKNHGWLVCLLLVALCAGPAYADDYTDGVQAYDEEDFAGAMALWKPIAEAGDPRAQYAVANLYIEGLGVAENLVTAGYWLERSAMGGLPLAQFRLGNAYREGYGFEKNDTEAVNWWHRAAENGISGAMYNLGVHYYFGRGVVADQATAWEWFGKAADAGHEKAQHLVRVEQLKQQQLTDAPPAPGPAVPTPGLKVAEPEPVVDKLEIAAAPEVPAQPPADQVVAEEQVAEAPVDAQPEPEPVPVEPVVTLAEAELETVPESGETPMESEPEVPETGRYTADWVLAQNPEHFTIQLAIMSDEDGVDRYLARHGIEGELAVFERELNGKTVLVVVLGSFATRTGTESLRAQLPPRVLRQNPWVRPFADVQVTVLREQNSPR
jgi:hypothetical protein